MYEKELGHALFIAKTVRPKIMEIYQGEFDVEIKEDNSPVTIADKLVDQMIREYLSQHYPDYAFLTEESEDDPIRFTKDFVWIIDPIDGTKDFVGRDGEFTVNIALSYRGEIVMGLILAPVKNVIYYATKQGGAFKLEHNQITQIHVNDKTSDLTVVTSRYHLRQSEKDVIAKHADKIARQVTIGASLKACLIAEGKAELSYRFSAGTKEWDIAPGQIIVEEAGGLFVKPDRTRYAYNRVDVQNREGYIMTNREENILL